MRVYKIIDILHKDSFDMESVAVIRDEITKITLNVVVNDHYVDSQTNHISGLYSKLEKGEYIKGELYLVLVSKIARTGKTYFVQDRKITHNIGSPSFVGEFEFDHISKNPLVVLRYPNSDILLRIEMDYNIIDPDEFIETLALRGELFLETIGYPSNNGSF